MNQRDIEYRKAKADGMREIAELFKATRPDIADFIRDEADRTEKGEE